MQDAGSVVLWGAAGKGIVLADALARVGVSIRYAVDADESRWGRFMEGSGLPVVSPDDGIPELGDSTLFVCNPRHARAVNELITSRGVPARLSTPRSWLAQVQQ